MPDDLFRKAKALAALRGQSMKQWLTDLLQKEIGETSMAGETAPVKKKKRKRPKPMPLSGNSMRWRHRSPKVGRARKMPSPRSANKGAADGGSIRQPVVS